MGSACSSKPRPVPVEMMWACDIHGVVMELAQSKSCAEITWPLSPEDDFARGEGRA